MGKKQTKTQQNKDFQTTLAQNQKAKNTWGNKQNKTNTIKQTKIFKLVWPWAP